MDKRVLSEHFGVSCGDLIVSDDVVLALDHDIGFVEDMH